MVTQIIAITALAMSSGILLYLLAMENRERLLQEKHQAWENEEAKRWESACSDPKVIEHYEQVAKEEYPHPEPFIPPKDVNTRGRPYGREEWRLTLPETAVRELNLAFGENSEHSYRVRRAIELSIEHLMEELADDAECARIIEERLGSNPERKTFDMEAYLQKRSRSQEGAEEEQHERL